MFELAACIQLSGFRISHYQQIEIIDKMAMIVYGNLYEKSVE